MAKTESIRSQLHEVQRLSLELVTFSAICLDLAGHKEGSAEWPWLVQQMAERIETSAHVLGASLDRVLPVVEDVHRVSRGL